MTAPAAIAGSLVDAKNVNMHKCVRLSIDVPAEYAEQIIKAFGWPTMAAPVAVAVARLTQKEGEANTTRLARTDDGPDTKTPHPAANGEGGTRRAFSELPLPQQAGICANDPRFWKFIEEEYPETAHGMTSITDDHIAQAIREICGIKSRAELKDNLEASLKWEKLHGEFVAWLAQ